MPVAPSRYVQFFFFNDTATTEIYTLSLHDALPIYDDESAGARRAADSRAQSCGHSRSEEHTSELQSRSDLVCRLLLDKKRSIRPLSSTSGRQPSLTN